MHLPFSVPSPARALPLLFCPKAPAGRQFYSSPHEGKISFTECYHSPCPRLNLLATSSHLFLTIHFVGSCFFFLPFLERKTNSPSPFLKLRVGCSQVQKEGWDFINSREIQVKRKKKKAKTNKNTLNILQDHHCWDIIS